MAFGTCDPQGKRVEAKPPPVAHVGGAGPDQGARPPQAKPAADPRVAPSELERYTEDIGGEGPLVAMIKTSLGLIECELFTRQAERTVTNFVGLARGKKSWLDPETSEPMTGRPFYDGLVFHRVIPGFMIQGGDPTGTGRGGPGFQIMDEVSAELRHDRPGVLSMANAGPNTAGSQFFIMEAPAPHLDGRHAVFGRCANLDIIRTISRLPADLNNKPRKPPTIESVTFRRGPLGAQPPAPRPAALVEVRPAPSATDTATTPSPATTPPTTAQPDMGAEETVGERPPKTPAPTLPLPKVGE